MKEKTITRDYLQQNPNHIFVFGDNTTRTGTGGAAILRDEPNTYGFITQNLPSRQPGSRYKPAEYQSIYEDEIKKLQGEIGSNPGKVFLISRIGGGLANEYGMGAGDRTKNS